jgi:mannobiose 2-epimerase
MSRLLELRAAARNELVSNILPFSMNHVVDRERGGFYGYVANDNSVRSDAPKGLVQHTRMLWTFARARRVLGDSAYSAVADHARQALAGWFEDGRHGGYFWMVDAQGQPLQTDKLTYGQAFAIYALAEDYLSSGKAESLDRAIALYHLLQAHCQDAEQGGYFEGCRREWTPAPDLRVDTTDLPVVKSMNVHLHMMEAYSTLLRAWEDPGLRASLRGLVQIMLARVHNREVHHLALWFDRDWHSLSNRISYGHDIEASWLLLEAAERVGDRGLRAWARASALGMAYATLGHGLSADGGLFSEGDPSGVTDRTRVWWPQAEAIIGFLSAYQLNRDPRFLGAALATWRFIQKHIIDHDHGDWLWGLDEAGNPLDREKAGPWKAAYHSGRACMEIMRRIDAVSDSLLPAK